MQQMTSSVCSGVAQGTEGRLLDTRDSKVYWVAKLKDNKCWMTQNLDLDLSTNRTLTNADTDVNSGWTPANNTYIDATPSFGTSNNVVESWNPAQGGAEKYCVSGRCNTISNVSSNDGHDAQGNYYSWAAATAGQAASLTSTTAGEQATQSICPKGWTLPTGGNNTGQFYSLLNGLSVAQIIASPYYFVYGGSVSSSYLSIAGSGGYYWSSTASTVSTAYYLNFSTSVNPSSYYNRYYGLSVRCVAR